MKQSYFLSDILQLFQLKHPFMTFAFVPLLGPILADDILVTKMSSDTESMGTDEICKFAIEWSPLQDLFDQDEDLDDTLIQLDTCMLESNQNRDLPPVHTLNPSQGQETATDTRVTTPQDEIDFIASVSEPNHENISENMDVVQNVNHEQADTVQIPPEFDNEFFRMSESEIQEFINGQQNKNTLQKTVRDVAMATKFLKLKNETRELHKIEPTELDPLLANFVLTVRKKDGGEYEPNSLRSIISSVDRKLKRMKYGFTILGEGAKNNDVFNLTRDAISAKQKVLKKQGKGNKPKKSQPLTDDEINMLYQKKLLGESTPESLLNTVWFNNTVHFGLRGAHEHYNLRWGDIKLHTTSDGVQYIELNERQTKTRTGANIADVREVTPKIFESGGDNDPIKMFKIYAEKRPLDFSGPEDPFYLAPRTIPLHDSRSTRWFLKQKVGEKKLSSIVKTMKEKASLDPNKRLTNHSARKYLVGKLRTNNIEGKDIMQISGHKNIASINNYSAISENKQREISNILSNTNMKPTNTLYTADPLPQSRALATGTVTNHGHADTHSSSQMSRHVDQSSNPFSSSQILAQSTSMFYGATLHIQNFNVYMQPAANPPQ